MCVLKFLWHVAAALAHERQRLRPDAEKQSLQPSLRDHWFSASGPSRLHIEYAVSNNVSFPNINNQDMLRESILNIYCCRRNRHRRLEIWDVPPLVLGSKNKVFEWLRT